METREQIANKTFRREKEKDNQATLPFIGFADSINPRTEKIKTVTPNQTRELDFDHPYISRNAWMRVTPEFGIKPIVTYRSDRFQPVILKYTESQDGAETRINDYFNKINIYRPLRPGEFEFSSSGFAQTYWASRAIKESRAGVVRDWLNQDELESGHKAPVHVDQLHDSKIGSHINETRFGIVKRYSGSDLKFVKYNNIFAREVFTNLKASDGANLYDSRIGHVFDDTGKIVKHTTTGKDLRALMNYFTTADSVKLQLDVDGNLEFVLPSSASEGLIAKILGGGLKVTVEKDIKIDGRNSLKALIANDVLIEAGGGARFRMSEGKVAFGTSANELLDLIYQAFTALSTAYSPGPGAALNTNPKFSELMSKIEQIKGNV